MLGRCALLVACGARRRRGTAEARRTRSLEEKRRMDGRQSVPCGLGGSLAAQVGLAALALLAAACGEARPPHPKNLLIVCVDTLRADELGAYGREPSLTPALDALAAESVVFERAHAAASWTLPSVGAVFTAQGPATTGLWTFESRLADSFTTLAERFRAAGF